MLNTTTKVVVVKSNVTDIVAIDESMELHLAPNPVVAGMFTLLHTKACRNLANNGGNQQDFEQLGDHSWIRAVKRGEREGERERETKVLVQCQKGEIKCQLWIIDDRSSFAKQVQSFIDLQEFSEKFVVYCVEGAWSRAAECSWDLSLEEGLGVR